MSTEFTWNCYNWLHENYHENNGLPAFFALGKYSVLNRSTAESEYRESVDKGRSSDDEDFRHWSEAIARNQFSVLNNTDVTNFWLHASSQQAKEEQQAAYSKLVIKPYVVPSAKKRASNAQQANSNKHPRTILETDGHQIHGLDVSLGSFIATLAHNRSINNKKDLYYKVLGMNRIVDVGDDTEDTHLAAIQEKAGEVYLDDLRIKIDLPENKATKSLDHVIVHGTHKKVSKRWQTWLNAIKKISPSIKDRHDINVDTYQHMIKLHLYSEYLFLPHRVSNVSETDYIVKVWGPLIEFAFRGTGIEPRWGETISEITIKSGHRMKMDLRLTTAENTVDFSTVEFARIVTARKYYNDKAKVVVSMKAQLNHIIKENPSIRNRTITKAVFPFAMVTGLEMQIFGLRLARSGLYVVDEISSFTVPLSASEVIIEDPTNPQSKTTTLSKATRDLHMLVQMCTDLKNIYDSIRVPTKKTSMKDMTTKANDTDNMATWIRDVWTTRELEKDDIDD
ncbi:hypothetical protein BJV82DRAFT_668481 [Fennellomyces sp. T-0311]|nr:hypothetical protein BJV82DRAFT_668481 [Fennellomyces sp. T-0311]